MRQATVEGETAVPGQPAPEASRRAGPSPGSVTVVIPARDARDDVLRCLESLRRQTVAPAEIVVVDDGSGDGTAEAAAAQGARVVRQERLGASHARNRGVVAASGEYVCFLDADCIAEPRWLEELCRPLREDPSLAGTIGRYETGQSSLIARFVQLEVEDRYRRMAARDRIDFLNSGTCAFRGELIARYPFDPRFQRLEDVELSFRLARDGHAMAYVPGAVVKHRHPESLAALLRRKFNYARYALPLYRQYPAKATGDTSTPQSRRWRLALLGVFVLLLPFVWIHPALLVASLAAAAGSLAFSARTIWSGFRISPQLGVVTMACLFAGSIAFVAGTARGVLSGDAPEAN
jgi:glycosyltransferase involved in cell wall biosynthesis